MTDYEDWFPPPVRLGGQYEEEHTQVGTSDQLLNNGNMLIKVTQAEVDHLAVCHPDDPFDVRVLSTEPLALDAKWSEVQWRVEELVKRRGEDRFEFYPVGSWPG